MKGRKGLFVVVGLVASLILGTACQTQNKWEYGTLSIEWEEGRISLVNIRLGWHSDTVSLFGRWDFSPSRSPDTFLRQLGLEDPPEWEGLSGLVSVTMNYLGTQGWEYVDHSYSERPRSMSTGLRHLASASGEHPRVSNRWPVRLQLLCTQCRQVEVLEIGGTPDIGRGNDRRAYAILSRRFL